MLMRSTTHFTGEAIRPHANISADRLTIRERIVETDAWSIAVPAIATLSVAREREGRLLRGALLTGAGVSALAGLANYALSAVMPALPVLIAALAATAICVLLSVRSKQRFVLAITTNDGSRCTVASDSMAEINDMRAFLAEKINRQDCGATRVFQLNSADRRDDAPAALTTAVARADATAAAPDVITALAELSPQVPPTAVGGSTDYASVLGQITDLHRFYEKHPQAMHIRERLAEMELLMRSGTPSPTQRTRVRELALDLTNIMSAYPHMTQLFAQVTSLAGR